MTQDVTMLFSPIMCNNLFCSSPWSIVGIPLRKDDIEVMVLV